MNDEYLWDRTGEPDPDVAQLERALRELRWAGRTRALKTKRRNRIFIPLAAALLLAIALGLVYRLRWSRPLTSWELSQTGRSAARLRTGAIVETSAHTRATIRSGAVGNVELEPESRLRLISDGSKQQRLALDHGTIHAFIWAPPARFVVDTPAARTVDLGCRYTLQVDPNGVGLLTVEMGWVAFEWHGTESFIPAGAACKTQPVRGPDVPFYMDAPADFKTSITRFMQNGAVKELRQALVAARSRDGLTLWHIMQRRNGYERGLVFDRFAQLTKLPADVTRERIVQGDQLAFDQAWNALDLGTTSWWREWQREWR